MTKPMRVSEYAIAKNLREEQKKELSLLWVFNAE